VEGVTFCHLGLGVSWRTGVPPGELYGTSVEQTVCTSIKTLPLVADLTPDLFTVAGGPVLCTQLFSIVTTVIQAQATTFQFRATATGLSAVTLSATVDLNAAAVGSVVSMTGTFANAAIISANQTHVGQASPVYLGPGIVEGVFGAQSTGAMQHYMVYKPLAPGATVIPA